MKTRLLFVSFLGIMFLFLTGCWWLIPNQKPEAVFYANPTSGVAPLSVTFNASASNDSDGSIERYDWSFGDGAIGRGRIVVHTYHNPGTYYPELTVTDNRDAIDTVGGAVINVYEPNKPPYAYFTTYWYNRETLTIILDPRQSYDPDGYVVEYLWNIAGRVLTYSQPYVLRVSFSRMGNYTISLTVRDNKGAANTYTRTLSIYKSNSSLKDTTKPATSFDGVEIEVTVEEMR